MGSYQLTVMRKMDIGFVIRNLNYPLKQLVKNYHNLKKSIFKPNFQCNGLHGNYKNSVFSEGNIANKKSFSELPRMLDLLKNPKKAN